MLKALKALISQGELRRWGLWKLRYPFDRGRRLRRSHPPYLAPWLSSPSSSSTPLALPKLNPLESFSKGEFAFRLASLRVEADGPLLRALETLWTRRFPDPEDTFAAHRFGWIFDLAARNTFDEGENAAIASIKLWEQLEERMPHEAWHPYTISERLANWGLLYCRTDAHPSFADLVSKEARKLFSSLEHFDDDLTGNHLLNNARGLLWAALLTGSDDFKSSGASIAEHELDRVVSPEGFLREGSSHYQFLVTRNCFEILWLATQLKVDSVERKFRERLPKMAQACRLFDLQGHHAAIGDLSPDAPPSWFADVANVVDDFLNPRPGPDRLSRGWARHFRSRVSDQFGPSMNSNDEFGRFDFEGFSVLTHCSPLGSPRLPGHGHCDALSFVAVYEGRPLVIDRGRRSYASEDALAVSTWFHNGVLVDGREAEFISRGIFGPGFLKHRRGHRPALTVLPNEISIEHHGFHDLGIVVRRAIKVQGSHLEVTTTFDGRGEHEVTLLLHSPVDGGVEVKWPEHGRLNEILAASENTCFGTSSPEYGVQTPCRSFEWSARVTLPWTGTIEIFPR